MDQCPSHTDVTAEGLELATQSAQWLLTCKPCSYDVTLFHWQHKATMQMCLCANEQFLNGTYKAYLIGHDMLTDMLVLAQMDKPSNH